MKVLFVTPALTIGGIEILALRLSEGIGKQGHEVILYDFLPEKRAEEMVAHYDTSSFCLEYFGKGHPVLDRLIWKINAVLYKTGLNKTYRSRLTERHFVRLLKRAKPDVICSLSFHQDYIACRYAEAFKIPVVVSMHGVYEYAAPQWPAKARFIYDHAKAIIYVADKNMSWYQQQPYFNKRNIAVKIYIGTELDKPILPTKTRADLGLSESDFVFIMVSRGIKEKGWQEALTAFRRVHTAHKHTALLLVGEGAYLDSLRTQYTAEPGVLFYGSHPNPIELTALANVGLLPSYFPIEALPNAIIEYLRCSLPVIASNIGEIPNMLTVPGKGEAGHILKRQGPDGGVSDSDLSQAMEQLVSDGAVYQEKVQLAKEAAEKFDMRKCVASYLELFDKVRHA